MALKKPIVSIIVPAYNAAGTLSMCLDSILAQTFPDFELIVTDDGSTDGTPGICDRYAAKDRRVKIIHKANSGVAAARNSGLETAGGEFVTFVDSDDSVKPEYLANLQSHVTDGTDLVISNACRSCIAGWMEERYVPVTVQGRDFDGIFANNVLHTSPWSKLYRRSVIEDNALRFPEDMRIGEDAVFLLSYMSLSRGVCVTADADYMYFADGGGSLTKKLYSYREEFNNSTKIDAAVSRLTKEKDFHSEKALHNINLIRSLYRERVLDSVYFTENFPAKERMAAIKSVDSSNLRTFALRKFGFRPWLLSHLLKWRMVALYDFVRSMASSVR